MSRWDCGSSVPVARCVATLLPGSLHHDSHPQGWICERLNPRSTIRLPSADNRVVRDKTRRCRLLGTSSKDLRCPPNSSWFRVVRAPARRTWFPEGDKKRIRQRRRDELCALTLRFAG